jgi:hypothetical protein
VADRAAAAETENEKLLARVRDWERVHQAAHLMASLESAPAASADCGLRPNVWGAIRNLIDAAEGVRDFSGPPLIRDQERHCEEAIKLSSAIKAAELLLAIPLPAAPAASGAAGTEVVEFWGVRAKQSMAVPPGCASPRRVQSQPFQVFASEREAQAEADRCGGVVFAIPGSEPAAPAASGAAGTEPMTWGIANPGNPIYGNQKVWTVRATEEIAKDVYHSCDGWVHFPLYAAPQAAPGWLTKKDREWLTYLLQNFPVSYPVNEWIHSLLARSSPPEVVLTAVSSYENAPGNRVLAACDVISAIRKAGCEVVTPSHWQIAAAGVKVKEVG